MYMNDLKKPFQIHFIRALSLVVQCIIIIYIRCQKHRFPAIFFLIFTTCFLYNFSDKPRYNDDLYTESLPMYVYNVNTSIYTPYSQVKYQSHKLILLWTDLFSNLYWHQDAFFNSSIIVSCSAIHQCRFTRDRKKLSQASLVAFHLYDINRHQLPPARVSSESNNQSWIFITGESPVNFYYQNPSFYPEILDNYFDQSISYKYDSPFSIFSPTLKSRLNLNERQMNLASLKLKKKPIVWIVSNCITFSHREQYVKELNKFIQIDIYGKCGIPCSKENDHQCQIDLNEYYFYLSFENSRCNSYITEKFWNIISNDTHRLVPIVMGAKENDYERLAPKQSFIHINQYKTPKELAGYLKYLINNPEKYLSYLQWRENTQIEILKPRRWISFLCPLCQMAYDNQISSYSRLNFSSWFNPTTECHHDDMKLFKQCKHSNLRDWMSWVHNIQCP